MKPLLLGTVLAFGSVFFAAQAHAAQCNGRPGGTVATQQMNVSAQHPNVMVGGQGMPAVGAAFTEVRSVPSDVHGQNPGYTGFDSNGE